MRCDFRQVDWMLRYILIETTVVSTLIVSVLIMCAVAKRVIWPKEPLHPSFVGSLISASGTIFAASLAWLIADNSVNFQVSLRESARYEQRVKDVNDNLYAAALIDAYLSDFPEELSAEICAQKALNGRFPPALPQVGDPAWVQYNILQSREYLDQMTKDLRVAGISQTQRALLGETTCDIIKQLRYVNEELKRRNTIEVRTLKEEGHGNNLRTRWTRTLPH
jgi:hypothetical protein